MSTSLTTEDVLFESLPNVAMPLHCSSCERIHYCEPIEAWVKGGEEERSWRPLNSNWDANPKIQMRVFWRNPQDNIKMVLYSELNCKIAKRLF
jgi:hypothetical protein